MKQYPNLDHDATTLPPGTRLHLPGGRTGTITGTNLFCPKYEVAPDEPTADEQARDTRHLIAFEDARVVK